MPFQPSAHRSVFVLVGRVLCLTVDTRVPRFCVGPQLVAIFFILKPTSQYDADLGVTSEASASGVNGVADDHSQFSDPSVCTM